MGFAAREQQPGCLGEEGTKGMCFPIAEVQFNTGVWEVSVLRPHLLTIAGKRDQKGQLALLSTERSVNQKHKDDSP